MNDQLERTPVAESDHGEVSHVAGGQTPESQLIGEGDDRRIHEAKAQLGIALVNRHGSGELVHPGT